ncbi:hypothetical protein CJU90_0291 [Yarrowia sp. C11]|nr:hypothetical protein CKK34_1702 [Yarrowia sp. E02]KAG5372642.1 hypothetical protein CJU90_0291 [Yarrowia sp. C11]
MAFFDKDMGAAALTFLVLYLIALIISVYILVQRGIKSRFTFIAIVCLIRVGAQLSGVGFSIQGFEHYQWLIAYLILGAEGYFSIVLAAYHFVAVFETHVTGNSFLRPTLPLELKSGKGARASHNRFSWYLRHNTSLYFHFLLIPANVILIVGGTRTIGVPADEWNTSHLVKEGKILRVVGQSIFLGGCVFILAYAVRLRTAKKLSGAPLTAVLLAGPPLLVRGAFGIISALVDDYNYYDFNNYGANGLKTKFLLGEYLMGATMEYLATIILLLSHFSAFSKSEMKKASESREMSRWDLSSRDGTIDEPHTHSPKQSMKMEEYGVRC